ncbi:hypothetical protein [Bacillus pumilus]|uniref:Uncharacterized protein n=1 Tax=Bacillus pumilus TaxID=1408 RepID=A0AAD0MLQ7_BACPU|nr:hypothetical protein [Bacillus pumilus]AVM24283.1 hypothetical protein C5695_10720 [Bacillus pumilus]TYS42805.1 hypothetical protein FZC68_10370 [Bacillus pumilus]
MSYEIQFKEVSIKKVVIEGATTLEEAQRMFNEGDYHNHKVVEIENIEKEIVDTYLLDNE